MTITYHNCVIEKSCDVTIDYMPVATISGETTICAGETTILTVNEAASYLWSTGGSGYGVGNTRIPFLLVFKQR